MYVAQNTTTGTNNCPVLTRRDFYPYAWFGDVLFQEMALSAAPNSLSKTGIRATNKHSFSTSLVQWQEWLGSNGTSKSDLAPKESTSPSLCSSVSPVNREPEEKGGEERTPRR